MSIVEDIGNSNLMGKNNDEKVELFYLDSIIQIYVRGNGYYREFANFLYRQGLNRLLDYTINELRTNKNA